MKIPSIERSVAPQPLSDATPGPRRRGLVRLLGVCFVGLSLLLTAVVLSPDHSHSGVPSLVVQCSSNMRQIGLAITMYANEHGGQFPASLHEILATEDVTPEVFVCPESNDVRAIGPTTQVTIDVFDQPGHCSYVYLGKGLTDKCDPMTPVLYEPMSNHHGGLNVLFADGHAEFLRGTAAQLFLKSIAIPQTRP